MLIMTSIGETHYLKLTQALREDIQEVDKGIDFHTIEADWGCDLGIHSSE